MEGDYEEVEYQGV